MKNSPGGKACHGLGEMVSRMDGVVNTDLLADLAVIFKIDAFRND